MTDKLKHVSCICLVRRDLGDFVEFSADYKRSLLFMQTTPQNFRKLQWFRMFFILSFRLLSETLICMVFKENVNDKCFFKIWYWKSQYDQFHTLIDKFYFVFKEFCSLWVLSPRIWNVLRMHFSKMNLLRQSKKRGDDPEIPKKLFFCFIFLGWKYGKSKHMVLSFNSHCKHLTRLPRGFASVP